MSNWYKKITLVLTAVSCFCAGDRLTNARDLIVTETAKCQEINSTYQEVYSFETENYYINVCQLEDNFYYHRQSKLTNGKNNIVVPAQAILQGSVFQATVGKIVYFVGVDSDRHYSSVMLNNNEIVFEPEIEPPSLSAVPKHLEVSDRHLQNASLELDDPVEDSSSALTCARDKSAFHPRLDRWQELIGKSIGSANKYAAHRGYEFDYNRANNPQQASITTEAGETIGLGIVPSSEIVEQVCIQSSEDERN